jgi:hypothetical protein
MTMHLYLDQLLSSLHSKGCQIVWKYDFSGSKIQETRLLLLPLRL